jgi:hypothetical protein
MTGQWSRDASTPPFIDLVPIEQATGARKKLYEEMQRVRGPAAFQICSRPIRPFPLLPKPISSA